MKNIEAMKSQTIGVEVEMNNLSRRDAIKAVADTFGTAWSITHVSDGYDSWVCRDGASRTWKICRDSSIRGPESQKCELVTPILTYGDMETLQAVIRNLRKAGAKSDPTRGCGVHIHIGAAGHTAQTLRNLANIMASHENLLIDALKIDRERIRSYCRTVNPHFLEKLNKEKPSTWEKLADLWYTENRATFDRNAHYNNSRYHMLNLHATFTKGTIEFRLFQFDAPSDGRQNGLHAGQLKAYIQLCLALSQAAKDAKSASPKQPQVENPKYAMRTWLLRLGFIGDEFATARDILTRNLAGDAAFRHGRPSAVA